MKKYVIILDTNSIKPSDDKYTFSKNIEDLSKFIKNHRLENVTICLPEMVIEERIWQRARREIERINQVKDELNSLNINSDMLPNEKDIFRKIREKIEEQILKYSVKKVEMPKTHLDKIINRALGKNHPFDKNGKGFKDTIIWHSVLDKEWKERIIFLTNDGDFNPEFLKDEFKRENDGHITFKKNIEEVKIFLEEELNLNTNLEEKHEIIKKEIKEKINNILFEIIGKESNEFRFYSGNKLLGGFFVKDIVFNNISENCIFIDLTIKGKTKLFESQKDKELQIYGATSSTLLTGVQNYGFPYNLSNRYPEEKEISLRLTLHKIGDIYTVFSHRFD